MDSTLQDIRLFLKSPNFNKDQAFDYLLTLQLVAKEKKHVKAGFYEAVMRAMREKSTSEDEQFKRYLEVLIGDKDQEKVLDLISKVDKAVKRKSSSSNQSSFPKRPRGGLTVVQESNASIVGGLATTRAIAQTGMAVVIAEGIGHHQAQKGHDKKKVSVY